MIDTIRLLVCNTANPENGVILTSIDADGISAPYGLFASGTFIAVALTASWPLIGGPTDLPTKLIVLLAPLPVVAITLVYLVFPTGRLTYTWLSTLVLCSVLAVDGMGSLLLHNFTDLVGLGLRLATIGLVVAHYRRTLEALARQQLRWLIIGLCLTVISSLLGVLRIPIQGLLSQLGTGEIWFEIQVRGVELIQILLMLMGPASLTLALLYLPHRLQSRSNAVGDAPIIENV